MNNPVSQLKYSNVDISLNNNSVNNIDIDDLLSKETMNHQKEGWTKLNKTTKINKLQEFALNYCENNNNEHCDLSQFLSNCIDRKKLLKSSDVTYDVDDQIIVSIPNLIYMSKTKKYTLKRPEKRQSTLKSLSSKKKISIINDEC